MTTNIFDGNSRVMATDSRWSIEHGSFILYLDDTGYEKIERRGGMSIMFAGDGGVIQRHRDWIRSSPTDFSSMPATKGMSVCMVEDSTATVAFQKHQDIEANNVYCAGTGARPAYSCWMTNKCSKKAVESAKQKDHYSGGEVKYVDFTTLATNVVEHNAASQMDIATVSANIIKRGVSMKIHSVPTGTPDLPLPKAAGAAANDEEKIAREEMAKLVANGQLVATAPCDGMHSDWSENDTDGYKRALAKMFGWKH